MYNVEILNELNSSAAWIGMFNKIPQEEIYLYILYRNYNDNVVQMFNNIINALNQQSKEQYVSD